MSEFERGFKKEQNEQNDAVKQMVRTRVRGDDWDNFIEEKMRMKTLKTKYSD